MLGFASIGEGSEYEFDKVTPGNEDVVVPSVAGSVSDMGDMVLSDVGADSGLSLSEEFRNLLDGEQL